MNSHHASLGRRTVRLSSSQPWHFWLSSLNVVRSNILVFVLIFFSLVLLARRDSSKASRWKTEQGFVGIGSYEIFLNFERFVLFWIWTIKYSILNQFRCSYDHFYFCIDAPGMKKSESGSRISEVIFIVHSQMFNFASSEMWYYWATVWWIVWLTSWLVYHYIVTCTLILLDKILIPVDDWRRPTLVV